MLKMPKYQKIRNRRDLLKAPGESRGIKTFLNSAFGVWLLTAGLGSLATIAYTNFQTCQRDADAAIERWQKLSQELFTRRTILAQRASKAKDANEMNHVPDEAVYVFAEFKESTINNLELERDAISAKVHHSASTRDLFKQMATQVELSDLDWPYFGIWYGNFAKIPNDDIETFKTMVFKFQRLNDLQAVLTYRLSLRPACSLKTSLYPIVGAKHALLEAVELPNTGVSLLNRSFP